MMSSSKEQMMINTSSNDEQELSIGKQLIAASVLPMVLRVAIELDLFEIMAKASPPHGYLSASEIASCLPARNPEAPALLERVLRFLASSSILTCTTTVNAATEDGVANKRRLYGLGPLCKYFVRNDNGVSVAPSLLLVQDKVVTECWYHMKDAILEGGIPFTKAHGMNAFEYQGKDNRYNEVFNKAMYNRSSIVIKIVLEKYKGFAGLKEIVDVGGGIGATLGDIVSTYPNIKGINFDLPHVVQNAPTLLGVEHVGGDMFESVPKGEVIFMKSILHNWSDDKCIKLLKNCWDALPECGKVVVVEAILSEDPDNINGDVIYKRNLCTDMMMLILTPGGKERTEKEYDALAKGAGFAASKLICQVATSWVIEFYKKV